MTPRASKYRFARPSSPMSVTTPAWIIVGPISDPEFTTGTTGPSSVRSALFVMQPACCRRAIGNWSAAGTEALSSRPVGVDIVALTVSKYWNRATQPDPASACETSVPDVPPLGSEHAASTSAAAPNSEIRSMVRAASLFPASPSSISPRQFAGKRHGRISAGRRA